MSIMLLCFTVRKPGMSFQDYKAYYEQHHSKNIYDFLGDDSPATYSRHYVERPSDGDSSHIAAHGAPAIFLTGQPENFVFDAVTIMTWENEEAYISMTKKFTDPDVVSRFTADEEVFLDRSKVVLMSVGRVPVTPPSGRAL
ncbi:hypothetical protein H2200_005075 [Cladophialophora chaetospira]|uniref:EthD domain-containing protein n=1 Tax=Cladophialophora chaetospira TaxID=386627 RepID=A0AA38XBA1_9EURO|nr:hypothetical protein H2200_005075 [Cladophialophora chaetospira]